jgi:hypothetical protein
MGSVDCYYALSASSAAACALALLDTDPTLVASLAPAPSPVTATIEAACGGLFFTVVNHSLGPRSRPSSPPAQPATLVQSTTSEQAAEKSAGMGAGKGAGKDGRGSNDRGDASGSGNAALSACETDADVLAAIAARCLSRGQVALGRSRRGKGESLAPGVPTYGLSSCLQSAPP